MQLPSNGKMPASISTIAIGIIGAGFAIFSFLRDVLVLVIASCSAFSFIIGLLLVYFLLTKNQPARTAVFKRQLKRFSILVPVMIGCTLLLMGIASKQYAVSMLGGLVLLELVVIEFILSRTRSRGKIAIVRYFLVLGAVAGNIMFGFLARGTLPARSGSQVWKLHVIDNPGMVLPNGLDPGDVDKDGFLDYVTNYEWDGNVRVAFHPGSVDPAILHEPWPAITVGRVANAESSCLGDVDGDGNLDVAIAHGSELGAASGVKVIWGPAAPESKNPSAWQDGGDMPATVDQGQFHFIRARDVNGDGRMDLVIGGRGTNPMAGLKWLEAPAGSVNRRDLALWDMHEIDPTLESGHGFQFGDVDADGDDDIAICNSDWDTPDASEMVAWYENPGDGSPAQQSPWPKRVIYRGPEFYGKEQVVLHDFSGDGFPEVVMQVADHVYFFINPAVPGLNNNASWSLVRVAKPDETRQRCRPIGVADFNNDGNVDILGMLIHSDGYLAESKATVFWMEHDSTPPLSSTWSTHPIKWGDGFSGFSTFNGEKWDMFQVVDVDADGDKDIVADCEEFHSFGFVFMAVVWFENPLL